MEAAEATSHTKIPSVNSQTESGPQTTPNTFFKENLKMVVTERVRGYNWQYLIPFESIIAIGAIHFAKAEDLNLKLVGYFLAYLASGTPLEAARRIVGMEFKNPTIKKVYPEIIGNISNHQFKEIIEDGARGFYSGKVNGLLSAVGYKNKLIDVFANQIHSHSQSEVLWDSLEHTKDPELKLKLVKAIEKKCKGYFENDVLTKIQQAEISPLEKAATSYLALNWNLLTNPERIRECKNESSTLENLKIKNLIKNANAISKEATKGIPDLPTTLIPFIRLFVLRRISEELVKNNLLNFPNSDFSNHIRTELIERLGKFHILKRESIYNPQSVTVGLEIQPDLNKDGSMMKFRVNYNDIQKIVDYAGFKKSPDEPFEFVLPPTRTPEAQLLMLRELIILTGIPIQNPGIQINFGGIENQSTAISLQRILLLAGRLESTQLSSKEEVSRWKIGPLFLSKGEINVRHGNGPISSADVENITPIDIKYPEFSSVAELRTSFAAENFFIFARGLIEASRIANFAKAYERLKRNKEIIGIEGEMARKFESILTAANNALLDNGFPDISKEWTRTEWVRFGEQLKKNSRDKFQKTLLSALA